LEDVFGDVPFTLDLVGKYFEHEGARARKMLMASPLGRRVTLRGLLSETDLKNLMAQSDITLYPSLGEGFGLPVAEGMMQGHVVFAFRNTSLPEIVGDAAVLANDNDFAGWGRDLKRLLDDATACADLRARAVKRAEIFSGENMKRRYREYFTNALARPSRGNGNG
jgi:glycosyltransferase involved in cell wall biosynthesis